MINLLKKYKLLLDKKIKDPNALIFFIVAIILSIGTIIPANTSLAQSNILYNNYKTTKNIIIIDGQKYEIIIKKLH